jgi:hypothetical protein
MDVPGVRITYVGQGEIAVFSILDGVPADFVSHAAEALRDVICRGCRWVVVDLSSANCPSSGGAGLLFYYHKFLMERGGKLIVVSAPSSIMKDHRPFIEPAIPIVETCAEAIALLRDQASSTVKRTS